MDTSTPRQRRRATRGYSLIEVIIATFILGAVLTAAVNIFVTAFRSNASSQTQTVAYKAAQDIMEQLMSMDYTTLTAQSGVTFDVLGIDGIPSPNNLGRITVTDVTPPGNPPASLLEIRVSVIYNGTPAVHSINVNLITRRARP